METPLFLYNSFSRSKEAFAPLDKKNVRMYVCGPTVYDRAHIGNARPVLVFDVLYRLLRHLYGDNNVTYVRNITDIDDKINAKAQERMVDIEQVTNETIEWFHKDMDFLGALRPNHEPRATAYVSQMKNMISKLLTLSFAYATEDGHVFFEVEKFSDYGQLSNKKLGELKEGVRIENKDSKKNPLDFVLWKPSLLEEPGWESPWGRGRPGWHIECSAMAKDILGDQFDIHGGGIDLIFPHHENEIAQSTCSNEMKKFANFWLHNGFLKIEGEKMSKSLNNFLTVFDLIERDFSGPAIRYNMLSTHYRQPLDWKFDRLKEAERIIAKWNDKIETKNLDELPKQVINALLDDLNTPLSIHEMHQLFNKGNYQDLGNVCGFFGFVTKGLKVVSKITPELSEKVDKLVEKRNNARMSKNFSLADKIRDDLLNAGIIIKDTGQDTTWELSQKLEIKKIKEL
ncbi:MAG: cysteine--tRNA ligase [Pseudomonadota bacterium]|nr:cysteine--tRNA ligase [Pseudomonadota bacterium]